MMQIRLPLPAVINNDVVDGRYVVPQGYTSILAIQKVVQNLVNLPVGRIHDAFIEEVLELIKATQTKEVLKKVLNAPSHRTHYINVNSKRLATVDFKGNVMHYVTSVGYMIALQHLAMENYSTIVFKSNSPTFAPMVGVLPTTKYPELVVLDALLGRNLNPKLLQGFVCTKYLEVMRKFSISAKIVESFLQSLDFPYRATQLNLIDAPRLPTNNLIDTEIFLQKKLNEFRETNSD